MNKHQLLELIRSATDNGWHILELKNKDLKELPEEIGLLTELKKLDLSQNELTCLPNEIGQLKRLQELNLAHNKLVTVPDTIQSLTHLERLNLSQNRLVELPTSLFMLPKLKYLNVNHNEIGKLPPQISMLTNLGELYVENNLLTDIPLSLKRLHKLEVLSLRKNRLKIPPEVAARSDSPSTIFNFYFPHQRQLTRPLHEAKVILVGQGSVGKTSIVHRLLDNSYNPVESKTRGIEIRHWTLAVDNISIRLNVWDFGGQEIMHATHQFFLTERSLYLLILDARQGEQENHLEYWLKIIGSFGGNAPIIVVTNKTDEHELSLDQRGLRRKYSSIFEFVSTSCVTGKGIDVLTESIRYAIKTMPHINDPLINSWFAVKEQLEHMERDYILYTEYVDMCQKQGIYSDFDQRILIGFLHDLGVVLNFQKDQRLQDTNVLNPEWVTKGVYQILNSNLLFQNKGVLHTSQLNEILDAEAYPTNKHLFFIIDMMQRFELCFPFADKKNEYLIPDLLHKEEPDLNWNMSDSLAFQFRYNILPSSIISRFIVRMHGHISHNTYWRNGVVLVNGGNKALIRADPEDKHIDIWVTGTNSTRRELLSSIRMQFHEIHLSIVKLEAIAYVPIPQYPGFFIPYKELLTLEDNFITIHFYAAINGNINVAELLETIDPAHEPPKKTVEFELYLKENARMHVRTKIISFAFLWPMFVTLFTWIILKLSNWWMWNSIIQNIIVGSVLAVGILIFTAIIYFLMSNNSFPWFIARYEAFIEMRKQREMERLGIKEEIRIVL